MRISAKRVALVVVLLALNSCTPDSGSPTTPSPPPHSVETTTTGHRPDELILVPTSRLLPADCKDAARVLGFAVPCPSSLPATIHEVRCDTPPDFASAEVEPKEGCALGESFILAPQFVTNPDISHLIIEAGLSPREGCDESSTSRSVDINGKSATLTECSSTAGLLSDHVLLRWKEGGTYIDVSVHGHSELDKDLVKAVAEDIVLVKPS